ncbi:MAG: hypothetical protein E7649_00575 [Ruminococcaceae bacterium]|nr:hypothetical protein [Oscillospiraceae bacterium]
MPIGKSSIQKRVAKIEPEKKNEAPELVATTGVAPAKKEPAKKAATTAKATTKKATTAKATTAKKPTAPKTAKTATSAKPNVKTSVVTNVAPETVEKVTGHSQKDNFQKIQLGGKLPIHLL